MGWTVLGSNPGRKETQILLLQNVKMGPGPYPAPYAVGTGIYFGGKAARA